MMVKTEIYAVIFETLYRDERGNRVISQYTVGEAYNANNKSIVPVKIEVIKDKIKVSFADGGSHTFANDASVNLFRRPVETKKEEK